MTRDEANLIRTAELIVWQYEQDIDERIAKIDALRDELRKSLGETDAEMVDRWTSEENDDNAF